MLLIEHKSKIDKKLSPTVNNTPLKLVEIIRHDRSNLPAIYKQPAEPIQKGSRVNLFV